MEIKVVEIKEETKEEAEEDNYLQYALKGQKPLAQGNTLGLECDILKSPCKGKSFVYVKLLPLQVGCSKSESKSGIKNGVI